MGEWESFQFGAEVTISHHDLGVTDEELAEMSDTERRELLDIMTETIMVVLNDQLVDEVRDAKSLTNFQRSFILNGLDDDDSRELRPRRRRRTR